MRLARRGVLLAALGAVAAAPPSPPAVTPTVGSRFFISSDGVRLHYLDAGPRQARTIVFVPGWTMPAWIWAPQIDALGRIWRVVAFDPRGQGDSDVAPSGYTAARRGQDLADLLAVLGPAPVVIVGWSLGVLDTLAYIHTHGDARLAGLVLVDNSVGEEPAPTISPHRAGPAPPRPEYVRHFVRSMFHNPPSEAYLDRLTEAALRTPEPAARALLSYAEPRTYWREAIYATDKPVLYVVRPTLEGQADNLLRKRPDTEVVIFANAGHALFVDEAARFNAELIDFIRRRIGP
jgi:non-heme chloroperoxidase